MLLFKPLSLQWNPPYKVLRAFLLTSISIDHFKHDLGYGEKKRKGLKQQLCLFSYSSVSEGFQFIQTQKELNSLAETIGAWHQIYQCWKLNKASSLKSILPILCKKAWNVLEQSVWRKTNRVMPNPTSVQNWRLCSNFTLFTNLNLKAQQYLLICRCWWNRPQGVICIKSDSAQKTKLFNLLWQFSAESSIGMKDTNTFSNLLHLILKQHNGPKVGAIFV